MPFIQRPRIAPTGVGWPVASSDRFRDDALCSRLIDDPGRPLLQFINYQEPLLTVTQQKIRVGHSPDPDDAFMFYALACDKVDTGSLQFTHELVDIETLNRRAFSGELELTAVSLHAYAHLADKYMLCSCGASMGDRYGPIVVAPKRYDVDAMKQLTFAVPGTLTTAYLTLRMHLGVDFKYVLVPFDQILEVAAAGEYEGQAVDAGLVIHEGQLTFGDHQLECSVDLGQWWYEETGLPLPLGANAVRRDLGPEVIAEVHRLLKASIQYGLDHRSDALAYAQQFGRGLDDAKADKFVGMYVNDWTLDFGPRGREAVATLLRRGAEEGVIPQVVEPEFVR